MARLVAADEDTVRDVIHHFNGIGPAALAPQWAGGHPLRRTPPSTHHVITPLGERMWSSRACTNFGSSDGSKASDPQDGST
nr:helix-turn-helix domain-containing protein [Streptosporangium canum]